MRKFLFLTLLLLQFSNAESDISSGREGGTYIQIAREIAQTVAKDTGLNMSVIPSKGSKENIKNMIENHKVKFSIIQHDIIQLLKRSRRGKYRKLGEDIRVLLPLYMEEVHILVRKKSNIECLTDIKKGVVAIGPKGSGTALSALLIFEQLFGRGTLTSDMIDRSNLKQAMEKLKKGEVDVVFAVGAQPIADLVVDGEYRLIPFDDIISDQYYETTIRKESYPWLERSVKVAGVMSFLVCNEANSIAPYKMREFGSNFLRRLKYLQDFGHKRWKEVKKRLPPLPSSQEWRYCKEFKRGWEKKNLRGDLRDQR
jgi:TRAP transporter TAXI family solute receptor